MAQAAHPAFDTFVGTVAKLRSPDGGCPWNRAQTHASIGDYMIEEAYEALDAIQAGNVDHLREELGDVLLQVVLHSQIAADAGEFTIDDVCATIDEKMIRRHPHVFGGVNASNANEVSDLWEQVKLEEKARAQAEGPADAHLLDDVPTHFPALLQAQKISRKAVAAGFEWDTLEDVWDKFAEERAELEAAYAAAPKTPDGRVLREGEQDEASTEGSRRDEREASDGNPGGDGSDGRVLREGKPGETGPGSGGRNGCETGDGSPGHASLIADVEMEFGDLLFTLVNVARKMGIDAESALRASNAKFRRRFAAVEDAARAEGRNLEELTLDEMEAHWQHAKRKEREERAERKRP